MEKTSKQKPSIDTLDGQYNRDPGAILKEAITRASVTGPRPNWWQEPHISSGTLEKADPDCPATPDSQHKEIPEERSYRMYDSNLNELDHQMMMVGYIKERVQNLGDTELTDTQMGFELGQMHRDIQDIHTSLREILNVLKGN